MAETNIYEIIELLKGYKRICMGFAKESHHKGNRYNTKYWENKAQHINQIIDSVETINAKINKCPECGGFEIEIFVDKVNFGCGDIYAPVHKCKCGFKWTDYIAEEVYQKNKELIDEIRNEN